MLHPKAALFLFYLSAFLQVKAQSKSDFGRWLAMLKTPYNDSAAATDRIWKEWLLQDSNYRVQSLQLIVKEAGASPGKLLTAKINLLKAKMAHAYWRPFEGLNCDDWCKKVVQNANELGDEHLLMSACFINAFYHLESGNLEKGLFYNLKAIELAEKLNYNSSFLSRNKLYTSSYLYTTHNYGQCLSYCRDIIRSRAIKDINENAIGLYNNTALSFRVLGNYDSAIFYFDKTMQVARLQNNGVWVGIAAGNIGDVLRMKNRAADAVALWQQDIDSCLKYNEPGNAGLTMAFLAEYYTGTGKKTEAAALLTKALQLNKRLLDRIVIYKIKARFLQTTGSYDSAFYYLQLHQQQNDSVNTVINRTNYEQLKLRLDFENNQNSYNLVLKEKKTEQLRFNFLMGSLAVLLLAGWLFISRQKLKYKLVLQQKQIADEKASSATQQLHLFTQTLLEKNEQIEQLTGRISKMEEQQTDELIHQTILTDDDWNNFKTLFEKAHPGFFEKLRQQSPDITLAEIRLAALIRLGLDNKQMASMQGISLSSVRGNKTRLRQRLGITSDNIQPDALEFFIKNL
ncbi:MAG: hypothetical protein K2Q24_15700 [Chitinophagaceae bacterium]|nr:hypothetical protein [Chitinophagaceae bacterium]